MSAGFLSVGSLWGLLGSGAIAAEIAPSEQGDSESKLELDDLRQASIISNSESNNDKIGANPESVAIETPNLEPSLNLEQPVAATQMPVQPLATPEDFAASEELAQVTSVSELSDVQPGDWAFTALQRLVEESGCLEGYPNNTFQGNRALTRYEFAAGLNACLDVVVQLIGSGSNLEEIRRLQEEFATELATVRADVDTLQTDVALLQANQFSTTTKFSAQLFTRLNFATRSGDIKAECLNVFVPARDPVTNQPVVRTLTDDLELTFSYYTWLNFSTSFTGKDRYSYGSMNLFPVSDARPDGKVNSQAVQVGVAFPDLFKRGRAGNYLLCSTLRRNRRS